ncbi:hypothetical protein AOR13_1458 [Alteromonas stellipolaris LMG 21856]|nr:hypothetical protein AOR13_1458 [Alteromonas stellipolaris LMG 21856]
MDLIVFISLSDTKIRRFKIHTYSVGKIMFFLSLFLPLSLF